MTTRNLLGLGLFAFALTALPLTMNTVSALPHANQALADDDSEDMDAPRNNWQQPGAFPNQGNGNQGSRDQVGQNRSVWNQGNRDNGEPERRQSRFSRNNRDGRDGGGRGGRDGGDND